MECDGGRTTLERIVSKKKKKERIVSVHFVHCYSPQDLEKSLTCSEKSANIADGSTL